MLRYALIDKKSVAWGGPELLSQWQQGGEGYLWVDSDGTDKPAEAQFLKEHFDLPDYMLRDIQHHRRPPKFDTAECCDFILLRGLDAETSDLEFGTIQLGILVGQRFLYTRHSGESRSINLIREQLEQGAVPAASPYGLGLKICQTLVERYLPIVLALEERLEAIEDDMFENPHDKYLEELTGYRTSLKRMRRFTAYHHQTMSNLQSQRDEQLSTKERRRLKEVLESLERLGSLQSLFYEMCGDLTDSYLSLSAHRLNEIMKVLTIITAIFVPLSFIAGLYGMNFQYMPELGARWGYFVVIGLMALIATGLLLLFRWKKWL